MKIAINKCYGGFVVTKHVFDELGIEWDGFGFLCNKYFGIINSKNPYEYRAHLKLIAALEKVGKENYNGPRASIEIIEIPNNIEWEIEEHDGNEWVSEKHRIWS